MTAAAVTRSRVHLFPPALAIGAGMVWSLGALMARLAEQSDAWQYLIWRSIGILVVVEVVALARGRGLQLRSAFTSGPVMLGAVVGLLVASLAFVYALKNTTAANAAFLASITPLIAVVLARFFLGERMTRVTIVALAVAVFGLLVMVVADLDAGNMKGNIAAIFSSIGFACYTVCIRTRRDVDWSPALPGYAALLIVLCVVVTRANGRPIVPPAGDIAAALVHGGILIVLGTVMFNLASRHVPAVGMTIFAQSETVFVPVWVFLKFSERPKPATLLGGAIILGAVIGKAIIDARTDAAARAVAVDPDPTHLPDAGPGSIA